MICTSLYIWYVFWQRFLMGFHCVVLSVVVFVCQSASTVVLLTVCLLLWLISCLYEKTFEWWLQAPHVQTLAWLFQTSYWCQITYWHTTLHLTETRVFMNIPYSLLVAPLLLNLGMVQLFKTNTSALLCSHFTLFSVQSSFHSSFFLKTRHFFICSHPTDSFFHHLSACFLLLSHSFFLCHDFPSHLFTSISSLCLCSLYVLSLFTPFSLVQSRLLYEIILALLFCRIKMILQTTDGCLFNARRVLYKYFEYVGVCALCLPVGTWLNLSTPA